MMSLNKVQVIGNITADPEVRNTPNGSLVANFSIATNRRFTDSAGVQQDQTEFHNIVAWTRLAEIAEQYIKKGHKVYVEGRLQTRSWEDQSGTKRYKTEIIAENIIMLTSRADAEQMASHTAAAPVAPAPQPQSAQKTEKKPEEEITIEDVPF